MLFVGNAASVESVCQIPATAESRYSTAYVLFDSALNQICIAGGADVWLVNETVEPGTEKFSR